MKHRARRTIQDMWPAQRDVFPVPFGTETNAMIVCTRMPDVNLFLLRPDATRKSGGRADEKYRVNGCRHNGLHTQKAVRVNGNFYLVLGLLQRNTRRINLDFEGGAIRA